MYTVFLAGLFHLSLVAIATVTSGQLEYLNPTHILGVSTVFPSLGTNTSVIIMGWLILVAVYSAILVALLQHRIAIDIIRLTHQKIKANYKASREQLEK